MGDGHVMKAFGAYATEVIGGETWVHIIQNDVLIHFPGGNLSFRLPGVAGIDALRRAWRQWEMLLAESEARDEQ